MNHKQLGWREVFFVTAAFATGAISSVAFADIPPAGSKNIENPAVNKLLADAQKATKAGNIPLAVIDLKNASSAVPKNGAVRAQLGTALLQSGDYYSAERELRQARSDGASDQQVLPPLFQVMLFRHEEKVLLDQFPEPTANQNASAAADIFKARALALENIGQSADASSAMEKSLQLRRDGAGLITSARLAQDRHDLPAALAFTNEAIKLMPGAVEPLLFKFSLVLGSNDLAGALKQSDSLIAQFPASLPVQFTRVEVLMRMNQNDKAKAQVDAILSKNPTSAVGIYYRALLMAKAGNLKGAWRTAQVLPPQFLQSQPGTALAVSQMAEGAGATNTGAAILSATIAHFPQDPGLRLRLAAIRLRQNDTVGALNALEPIRDALDPAATELLSRVYLKAGRPDDALVVLQKLAQSAKGTDATTLQVVSLEAQRGLPEQALKDLTQAVSQKPTDAVLVSQLVLALARRGKFAEALSAADKLGDDPKQRPVSLALRAQVLMAQRNLEGALAAFDKAVQLDPKNPGSLYGRASVLELMQRYADADNDLHAILNANPKNIPAYLKLAEIAALQHQDQPVRAALAGAIKEIPADPAPRIALVRYLMQLGDRKGALAAANDLVRIQPANMEGLVLLGQAQTALGQKGEAVATFRRLAAAAPASAAPQVLLGNALFVNGDRAGASSALKTAVGIDPKSAEVRLAQISLQFSIGNAAGAEAAARDFRNANPGSGADLLLGDTLARAGKLDQAATVFQQSFAAQPNNTVLLRIVHLKVVAGDTKSAADMMTKWLDKNPNDSGVRAEYATMLMQQGDKAKAAVEYQTVLQHDPNNVVSLNNLGWLKQNDDPRRALTLVSLAAKLAPNSPEVLDTLGWLELQQKQAANSLTVLERAHNLNPKQGETTYHLVLALDATGSHDAARGLLKALLASHAAFNDLAAANKLSATWH